MKRRLVNAWPIAVPVAVGITFYAVFIARTGFSVGDTTYFSLFDDAMISMSYARNLAEGDGLVWQPGATVEGYSNLLWTLWMAVPHVLGVPESKTSLFVMLSGAAILVANLFVVRAIVRRVAGESQVAEFSALLLTALFYPLVFWALRGMEVGLATFAISALALQALRARETPSTRRLVELAAIGGAAILVRDDLFVPVAVAVAFGVWSSPRRLPAAAIAGGGVALVAGLHELFRMVEYGEALPNTYHLKVDGVSLTTRVKRGLIALVNTATFQLYAAVLLAAAGVAAGRRYRDPRVVLIVALVVAQAGYCVYVGGDAWEGFNFADRYLAAVGPLLFVLAALGVQALADGPPRRALAVGVAVGLVALALASLAWPFGTFQDTAQLSDLVVERPLVAVVAAGLAGVALATRRRGALAATLLLVVALSAINLPPLSHWVTDNATYIRGDAYLTRYGLYLGRTTAPDTDIAVVSAGALPYWSHRPTVDLLGKSDEVIARGPERTRFHPGHNKWDYSHSIGRLRPAVIAQIWRFSPEVERYIAGLGYRRRSHAGAPAPPVGTEPVPGVICCGWERP